MKKLALILFIWCGLIPAFRLHAQDADAVFQRVSASIQNRDAAGLSSVMNTSVELTVPGVNDGAYAANQAQFVLRDFFNNYPVSSFRIVKKGNTGNTFYAVGSYVSAKGVFDTNIFVRNMGGSFLVTQIRFEAAE